jgi:hypothetical protein
MASLSLSLKKNREFDINDYIKQSLIAWREKKQ